VGFDGDLCRLGGFSTPCAEISDNIEELDIESMAAIFLYGIRDGFEISLSGRVLGFFLGDLYCLFEFHLVSLVPYSRDNGNGFVRVRFIGW